MSKRDDPAVVATAAALLQVTNGRMKLPHVLAALQISKTTLYVGIARGIYPAPLRIGARAVAWASSSIRAVLAVARTAGEGVAV